MSRCAARILVCTTDIGSRNEGSFVWLALLFSPFFYTPIIVSVVMSLAIPERQPLDPSLSNLSAGLLGCNTTWPFRQLSVHCTGAAVRTGYAAKQKTDDRDQRTRDTKVGTIFPEKRDYVSKVRKLDPELSSFDIAFHETQPLTSSSIARDYIDAALLSALFGNDAIPDSFWPCKAPTDMSQLFRDGDDAEETHGIAFASFWSGQQR